MLPKQIYELLPYLYLLAGAICFAWLPHPLGAWSGWILLHAGGLVWVMRSNRRRQNPLAPSRSKQLPFWLYELLPFLTIGGGLFLLLRFENPWLLPSAVLLLVAGLQIWWLRFLRRHRE